MSEPALIEGAVEAARARLLALASPMGGEDVRLEEADGRVLAQDVIAVRDQPPFAASAMDGYAVRAADTPGALRVAGQSSAGAGFEGALAIGDAVRIFTGAPVPAGANAVIMQESVSREGDRLRVPQAQAGQNIRPRGLDFLAGEILLARGRRLDPIALALAAAAGAGVLHLSHRPRVSLFATGDEIVPPGAAIGAHQIYDSISAGLARLISRWGGAVTHCGAQADSMDAIEAAARAAIDACDVVITIGGASVGDKDLVKPALQRLGLSLTVERIAVRPGKPVWCGRVGDAIALGLPGNPASAFVCAHLFARPLLARLSGCTVEETPRFMRARLTSALPANGPREHYVRAGLSVGDDGVLRATPFEDQDSSRLSVFRDANALIRLAPRVEAHPAGALIDVLPLTGAP